jgi:hypothetical protein
MLAPDRRYGATLRKHTPAEDIGPEHDKGLLNVLLRLPLIGARRARDPRLGQWRGAVERKKLFVAADAALGGQVLQTCGAEARRS